jgi:hypothetical protein
MVKNQWNLYSNGQIHIQTIKFKFKRTNQETTPYYHPSTLAVGGSARADSNTTTTARSDRAQTLSSSLAYPPPPTCLICIVNTVHIEFYCGKHLR